MHADAHACVHGAAVDAYVVISIRRCVMTIRFEDGVVLQLLALAHMHAHARAARDPCVPCALSTVSVLAYVRYFIRNTNVVIMMHGRTWCQALRRPGP